MIPSIHQLRAAVACGSCIDSVGTPVATARESYSRVPTDGLFGAEDFIKGESILVLTDLLRKQSGVLYPSAELSTLLPAPLEGAVELLLSRFLVRQKPIWFDLVTGGSELLEEHIPDPDLDALRTAMPDPQRREAFLLALGQKADPSAREEVGASGEEFIVSELCMQLRDLGADSLVSQVVRVSEISDQLGYDIVAPTLTSKVRRIEVKATTKAGRTVQFFLSRNEATTGVGDRDWYLVACRLDEHGDGEVLGHCRGGELAPHLPNDQERGRWQTVAISMQVDFLQTGLPPLMLSASDEGEPPHVAQSMPNDDDEFPM